MKNDIVTPEDAIINLDEKTLGGAETRNSYLRADEQDLAGTTDDRTITYFGGYFDQHRFVWEVDGEAGFPGIELMRLDYDSKLKLQSATTGGNYITFDPEGSTIGFTHTGGSFSLSNTSGVLKVGSDTVVTQDSNGDLNLATGTVGTISGDLVVGDGNDTEPGLTVNKTLVIKHPTDSAYDAHLHVEDNSDTTGGVAGTKRQLVSNRDIRVGHIVLGRHPIYPSSYAGLSTEHTKMHFTVHDGASYRDRLSLDSNNISAIGRLFLVKRWGTTPSVFKVDAGTGETTADEFITPKLSAGTFNTATGDNAQALGHYVDADSFAAVVVGTGNDPAPSQNATSWVGTDELFVVGNGYDGNNGGTVDGIIGTGERSNALVITKAGDATFSGEVDIARIPRKGDILMGSFGQ